MKKGFTLAEVLITLAIIGVVATLTLPALMTNTGEQQAKTALKKGISTLTDAAQMNSTVKGYDYGGIFEPSDPTANEERASLWNLFTTQLAVDWDKTKKGKSGYKNNSTSELDATNYTIFLRDGSSIIFAPGSIMDEARAAVKSDQLPQGIAIVFDINGNKGPNQLSNCNGELKATTDKDTSCYDKSKRVFKDRYGLRLRNSVVVPNGGAAKYLYEN